jgi:iron complex transport system substrate-binding protein
LHPRAIHDALGEAVTEQISLVRFSPARTRMYLKESFCGAILEAIGFARPAAQDKDAFAEDLTKERIPELAADRIFYFSPGVNDAEGEANLTDWLAEPLWLDLEAVQAGQTYRVDDSVWIAGGGIYAANAVLDDIEAVYGLASTR